jgi:hypothetical protein
MTFETLKATFKSVRRVMTGEVVQRIETYSNSRVTKMDLSLKREKDGLYVVLAELSRGNRQYVTFSVDEFRQFSQAVQAIEGALNRAAQ